MPEVSKNPYRKDENDPRWRAVEIRRALEEKGYEIVNGPNGGAFDPKSGKNVLKGDDRKK